MKILLTPLALILFFSVSLIAQEIEVLDCVLRDSKVAVCVDAKGKEIRVGPIDWTDETFAEWLLQSDHWNFPLKKVTPVVGQKLKVTKEDGQLFPLASCEVRVHRRVAEWSLAHTGQLVPFTIMEPPKDCQK